MCVELLHIRKSDFSRCLQLQLRHSEKVTAYISDHSVIAGVTAPQEGDNIY